MTTDEFIAELDVIYENINKNGAPGLDNYERSVILTHAQERLVNEVLKQEPSGDRFPELIGVYTNASPTQVGFSSSRSYVFPIPDDIVKILNEDTLDGTNTYTVLPISNEQYQVKKSKPYSYPPRRRAWRLGLANPVGSASVEIVPRNAIVLTSYRLRYVRKPTPIVVADLSLEVPAASIDGITAITQCELSEGLHREILKIAAFLAEQYYYDKYGTDGDK